MSKAVTLRGLLRARARALILICAGILLLLARCVYPYPSTETRTAFIGSINQDGKPPLFVHPGGHWDNRLGDPVAAYQYTTSWNAHDFVIISPIWKTKSVGILNYGRTRNTDTEQKDAIINAIMGQLAGEIDGEHVAAAYTTGANVTRERFWWPGLMVPALILAALACISIGVRRLYLASRSLKHLRCWRSGPPYPCPKCGYDIGRVHSPCPECGSVIEFEELLAHGGGG